MLNLSYVRDLMAKNYEAVGFIPTPRVEEYARRGQILMQAENDDPCGYLIFGNGWPTLKVYQCCIQFDARRLDHATNLVNRLIGVARNRGCTSISLWCADDLDANVFWRAFGFHFAGQRDNGNRRGRLHNRWILIVPEPRQFGLFANDNFALPGAVVGQSDSITAPVDRARSAGAALTPPFHDRSNTDV